MTPDLLLKPTSITVPGLDNYTSDLVYSFSYSPRFWVMVMTLCSEIVFYPLFSNRLPSILTNIGIGTLFVLLFRIAMLIVSAIKYVCPLNDITWHWPLIIYCTILGCISQFMLSKLFEFVCAQSPYNMRGVLTGYVGLLFFSAIGIGAVPFFSIKTHTQANTVARKVRNMVSIKSNVNLSLHCRNNGIDPISIFLLDKVGL